MTDKPQNMNQIWAENGDKTDPGAAAFSTGWPTTDPVTGEEEPARHDYMNFLQNKMTKFIAHVNEYGISVWDATTTYTTGSWARSPVNNRVYVSTVDNNIGHEPSVTPSQWSIFDISANIGDTLESYETTDIMLSRGYLAMNGQAVSRTTYAELFALIGTQFGDGDGSTTFNLPGELIDTSDGFVLFREFTGVGMVRINLDGEMFTFSKGTAFQKNDTIYYQYANPVAETYEQEVSLGDYGSSSYARELVPNFLFDGSFFLSLKDDDLGSVLLEYKNNEMSIISLGGNYATSGDVDLFTVDDNREILSYFRKSVYDPSTVPHHLYIYDIPNDARQEIVVPKEEFSHCPNVSAEQFNYGGVAALNGVSFSFFSNKSQSPSIQNYRFYDNDQNNRTFSSCNPNPNLDGFSANRESPAYFQSDIYKTATGGDSPEPGIVFRTNTDGVMDKVCESPHGARMAGIYNGDIYIYSYETSTGKTGLYRKENRFKWIKAL